MSNSINKSSGLPIVALLLFLAAFAGGMFYVKPTWDQVSNMQAAGEEKVTERNELNSQLVELQTLQQELQGASEVTRQTTLTSIPERLEQDKLIDDLSRIASENDMLMNGINFGIPTTAFAGEVSRVSINTNVTGNQSSLLSYLKAVEGNTRKLVVKSITVQVGETDIGISRVNFNVNMEAYFQGVI